MQPTKYIWMDGEFVDWDDATIHVLSHGLHYGTGAFEGIRAYETDRGPAVFRLTEHIERLARSSKALGIPIEWSVDEIVKASKELFSANGLTSGYIRPLVYYGTGSMGLNPAGASAHTMERQTHRRLCQFRSGQARGPAGRLRRGAHAEHGRLRRRRQR
jgi:branched-chain amino acid aminotransferase